MLGTTTINRVPVRRVHFGLRLLNFPPSQRVYVNACFLHARLRIFGKLPSAKLALPAHLRVYKTIQYARQYSRTNRYDNRFWLFYQKKKPSAFLAITIFPDADKRACIVSVDIDVYGRCVFVFQIVGIQQYLVKPTEVDQNENTLSDQVTSDIGITEKMVKTSGIPLQDAIEKVSRENCILLESSMSATARAILFLQIVVRLSPFVAPIRSTPTAAASSVIIFLLPVSPVRYSHVTRVICISTTLFFFKIFRFIFSKISTHAMRYLSEGVITRPLQT